MNRDQARWPADLGRPADPMENVTRYRAQSILSGPDVGVCPPMTLEQAQDVLRWYSPQPMEEAA